MLLYAIFLCEEVRQKECVEKRLSRQNLMFRNRERQKEKHDKIKITSITSLK
jgi:hypothetical protein